MLTACVPVVLLICSTGRSPAEWTAAPCLGALFHLQTRCSPNGGDCSAPTTAKTTTRPSVIARFFVGLMGPLVVVGSVNADLVLQTDRIPVPGETMSARNLETFPGGKGANQAAAAAKLGHPTYFVGQVGTDANGEFVTEALSACGVNISFLKEVGETTGTAVILLQPSGENSILIVGGANQKKWNIQLPEQDLIRSAGAVLLQREIPDGVNLRVAELASAAGVPVVLDVGGVDAPLPTDILQHLTILSPNETELARISGTDISSEAEAERIARQFLDRGVDQVLIKLGSKGSMLVNKEETIKQPAIPVSDVVDTTGAGDCFTAAYAVGLLSDMSTREALLFATKAASICVQRKGAMSSLPYGEEVDALL